MKHLPQVIAAMTPFPHAVDHDVLVADAMAVLAEHRFHHLPVTEHGHVTGMVTVQDLKTIPPQWRVRHVMRAAYVVDAAEPIDRVLHEMIERHLSAAIVTKGGKLVGVFTSTDACTLLLRMLHERFGPTPPGTEAA